MYSWRSAARLPVALLAWACAMDILVNVGKANLRDQLVRDGRVHATTRHGRTGDYPISADVVFKEQGQVNRRFPATVFY